jgi:hypothetical protein
MKSAEMVDHVRDMSTRMADVTKLEMTSHGTVKVLKNMEKQRQSDLDAINANFKAIDKRLSSSPKATGNKLPAIACIAKSTAAGAMYYGPRTVLFLVITVASIAVSAIFYGNQFEQSELVNTAWLAVYASAGAFLPSVAMTWLTRRK